MAKLSAYIPGLANATTDIKHVLGTQRDPYKVLQQYGTHHVNQFDIQINLPEDVMKYFNSYRPQQISGPRIAQKLNYYCIQANIPQQTTLSTPIRLGGQKIQIPVDRQYSQVTLTFYIDGGYKDDGGVVLAAINTWMEYIYSPYNKTFAYMDDYTSNITIKLVQTPDGQPLFGDQYIGQIILHQAWPTDINVIQLSGVTSTQPTRVSVSFKYRYLSTVNLLKDSSALQNVADLIKNGFRVVNGIKDFASDVKQTVGSVKNAVKEIKDWF